MDDFRRGTELISELPDLRPSMVGADLHELYDDIQRVLRVPIVNRLFRTLANWPDYLQEAWYGIRPTLLSRGFETSADELRAMAAPDRAPTVPNRWKDREGTEPVRFTETICYVLPKLLLIASALSRGAGTDGAARPADQGSELALGPDSRTLGVELFTRAEVSEDLQRLYDDIVTRHGHPGVASYYQGLANWPWFLGEAWELVVSRVHEPEYQERRRDLRASADDFVATLWSQGVPSPEPDEDLAAVLSVFRDAVIPDLLLDVSLIHAGIVGSERAASVPFSAARPLGPPG